MSMSRDSLIIFRISRIVGTISLKISTLDTLPLLGAIAAPAEGIDAFIALGVIDIGVSFLDS